MEEDYLVYDQGSPCGSMRARREGLYVCFLVCCRASERRLYSLFLEGERTSLLLGVPEWQGGQYVLHRRLAKKTVESVGALRCARLEARESDGGADEEAESGWLVLDRPEYFFRSLTPQLMECGRCYWKPAEDGRFLAVPMEERKAFLLPSYFCFAHTERLWGRNYAVFFFDAQEQPCFSAE